MDGVCPDPFVLPTVDGPVTGSSTDGDQLSYYSTKTFDGVS